MLTATEGDVCQGQPHHVRHCPKRAERVFSLVQPHRRRAVAQGVGRVRHVERTSRKRTLTHLHRQVCAVLHDGLPRVQHALHGGGVWAGARAHVAQHDGDVLGHRLRSFRVEGEEGHCGLQPPPVRTKARKDSAAFLWRHARVESYQKTTLSHFNSVISLLAQVGGHRRVVYLDRHAGSTKPASRAQAYESRSCKDGAAMNGKRTRPEDVASRRVTGFTGSG